jgi:hypothetical protein
MPEKRKGQTITTRRTFLGLSGRTALAGFISSRYGNASGSLDAGKDRSEIAAARGVLKRLLPEHQRQVQFRLLRATALESFRFSGSAGQILVEGSTISSLLMGLHWYLKYVACVSISWNGDSIGNLSAKLPGVASPMEKAATVCHRFALNDTNDGYTGPYWSWEQWEHQIDVLALHGINEVLVYTGAQAVYQETFRNFQLSERELQSWFPLPAHQPWWLLGNMSSWVGLPIPQHLIDSRLALAQKITSRLRELKMTPVLPGYFGVVPDGFASRNPSGRVISQGTWLGIKRPDWLDPTGTLFADVAQEYYRVQERLLGSSSMFKMDPFHEGGETGDVQISSAVHGIDRELQRAHPGAIWAVLGWLDNPKQELLAGVSNKENMLILDGQADRYDYQDREQQWDHTPYAFGTIWNFGGHTTMGANIGVWNQRFFDQLNKPDSKLKGIALLPEASCNNPVAFAFFTELAWRSQKVDLPGWFSEWSAYRYGAMDKDASQSWQILCTTAYSMKSGKWSEAHDGLFGAQPDLNAKSACTWSPSESRYDLQAFSEALKPLLGIRPSLRNGSAYRYDLVDVARQVVSNRSRVLLPQINAAYVEKNLEKFQQLTQDWLKQIELLARIASTEASLLLGKWTTEATIAAKGIEERAQFEFDACSLLLEWGPESSRRSGVRDYANREWNGLLQYYGRRWATYFSALKASLSTHEAVKQIDWFAMDQDFARQTHKYPDRAQSGFYETIQEMVGSVSETGD